MRRSYLRGGLLPAVSAGRCPPAAVLAAAVLVVLPAWADPTHAQTCPPPCLPAAAPESTVVLTVDTSGVLPPSTGEGYGVLRRSGNESPAPLIAMYIGVSAVGATLALLTSKRRLDNRKERERQTGIAHGRRRRDEFWREPMAAAPAGLES